MTGPANKPEKVPTVEELKKIKKPRKRGTKNKCLACNNGKILFHGVEYDCKSCSGTGFII